MLNKFILAGTAIGNKVNLSLERGLTTLPFGAALSYSLVSHLILFDDGVPMLKLKCENLDAVVI